ncbi:hypothetical protein BJV74DRAFT_795823 [Russula compacta]|nr:hypothetical protein BJV74DRAFT_795823 [Russula compacta]
MEYSSFSASQPILPSATLGAVPDQLTASSSQGAIPSSWSQAGSLDNATKLLGLKLPPNALKVIAQCQASGRFSALLNPPPGNTKSIATARRRPTVRSHSQPNMPKSGHASAHARAGWVPKAKPVPQPPDATHYQPPPVKARARRVAQAARSKARATARPMVVDGPESPLILTSSLLERAQEISRLPGLGGIPIKLIQSVLPMIEEHSKPWVEGDAGTWRAGGSGSSRATVDENPLPTVMEESTAEAPELPYTASIPEQHEPFPPAWQPELGPMTGAWDWRNTLDWDFLLEVTAPLMEPPVEARITDVVDEESGGQEPSAALEHLLDLEYNAAVKAARSETRISPPTREESERSLCPRPNGAGRSTEFGCGADIVEAEMGKLGKFGASLQDDDWEGFIDFSCLYKA